jgi:hypothetical protein
MRSGLADGSSAPVRRLFPENAAATTGLHLFGCRREYRRRLQEAVTE